MMNTLHNGCCLAYLKTLPDCSVDLIFCDPPYALGSEVIIKPNGKPDYKKAVDFMSKWEQPDGKFWERWFMEANRVLKYGGRVLMFGMDRQLFLNCYYANLAGFTQQQSLYWFFISNFPKATDCSKQLDKHFKAEREVVGKYQAPDGANRQPRKTSHFKQDANENNYDLTAPTTNMAKKYDGFKYGIAPLKQTNETIMVFQKPCKTGSPLHDILAMENGDATITASIVDIENNRVATSEDLGRLNKDDNGMFAVGNGASGHYGKPIESQGRFPAQTFVDSAAAERLDSQSQGIENGYRKNPSTNRMYGSGVIGKVGERGYLDSGGCSKILHKCDYDKEDHDLYFYCSKVSGGERNEGLQGRMDKKIGSNTMSGGDDTRIRPEQINENNHPTLKPISLLVQILRLFKTPNEQVLLDPFAGTMTMGVAANKVGGFEYVGIELDPDYFAIAKERIAHVEHDLINLFG